MPIVFCYRRCSLFSMRVDGLGVYFSGSIVPSRQWNKFQWGWRLLKLDTAIYSVDSASVCVICICDVFTPKKAPKKPRLRAPTARYERGAVRWLDYYIETENCEEEPGVYQSQEGLRSHFLSGVSPPHDVTSWCHPSPLSLLTVFAKKKRRIKKMYSKWCFYFPFAQTHQGHVK